MLGFGPIAAAPLADDAGVGVVAYIMTADAGAFSASISNVDIDLSLVSGNTSYTHPYWTRRCI